MVVNLEVGCVWIHLFLLLGAGGGLVCESVGKADILLAHFDGKQSRDPVDLPVTCHPSQKSHNLCLQVMGGQAVLPDLDSHGGTDPLGTFPLFLSKTAVVLASRLAVVFLRLLRFGSFPAGWRVANVTPIPECPPSSSASWVFYGWRGVLPTTQLAYRKGLGTCDAFLCVAHTLQNAVEMGQEPRIVQINFSAAFDRVNNQGILFKLCSVGVGGSVLSVLTQFLSKSVIVCRGGWLS